MRDNSQVLAYRRCPLSWHNKYVLGLEKIQEDSVEHDRNFGKAIHSALAEWWKQTSGESALEIFKNEYSVQLNEDDKAKTQENGLTLLAKYFERYASDKEKYELLAVEERIDFKVGGMDFCVKCDTVVRDKKYGQVYSLEHKTTKKSLTFDYWGQYDPNSQLCAQTAGVKAKYGECAGVIVDAMSFGFRQRAYKGEPAGFHMDFGRMEYNLNQGQLDQWERSTIKTLEDIESDLKFDRWAMNTDSCRFCSYKAICQAAWQWPEDKELILLTYQQKANPLDYLNVVEVEA